MKYSCYQESSVIHGWFLFIEFLVEKCAVCQSRKSNFGWHRFRFSPFWMRVEKSQAILAILDCFQELHLIFLER